MRKRASSFIYELTFNFTSSRIWWSEKIKEICLVILTNLSLVHLTLQATFTVTSLVISLIQSSPSVSLMILKIYRNFTCSKIFLTCWKYWGENYFTIIMEFLEKLSDNYQIFIEFFKNFKFWNKNFLNLDEKIVS